MAPTQDESLILALWDSSEYNAEEPLDDLIEIIKKHEDKLKGKYYIHLEISKNNGFVESNAESFKL